MYNIKMDSRASSSSALGAHCDSRSLHEEVVVKMEVEDEADTNELPLECEIIQYSSDIPIVNDGLGDKVFVCPHCELTFQSERERELHVLTHSNEKVYSCRQCRAKFCQSSHLETHKCSHKIQKSFACKSKSVPGSCRTVMKSRKHTQPRLHRCEICDRAFRRPSDVRSHMKTHSGERPFKCNICFRAFTRPTTLKLHEKTHSVEKIYYLEVQNGQFIKHFETRGKSERPNQMTERPEAKSSFPPGSQDRKQSGVTERIYTCDVCSIEFKESSFDNRSGLKNYLCAFCEQNQIPGTTSLSTKIDSTDPHVLEQMECVGITNSACKESYERNDTEELNTCDDNISSDTNLDQDLIPPEIVALIKKESQSSNNHQTTDDKPFWCEICLRTFRKDFHLKAHMKTHGGERSFLCGICKKTLPSSSLLKAHVESHKKYGGNSKPADKRSSISEVVETVSKSAPNCSILGL